MSSMFQDGGTITRRFFNRVQAFESVSFLRLLSGSFFKYPYINFEEDGRKQSMLNYCSFGSGQMPSGWTFAWTGHSSMTLYILRFRHSPGTQHRVELKTGLSSQSGRILFQTKAPAHE